MKKVFALALSFFIVYAAQAQFVARMEVKEPIPGVCDNKNVVVLMSMFKGQKEAVCPVTKDSIEKRLNAEVDFLKDKPDYSDKGMVNIIINCKGEVVQCQIDNKTKSADLDKQIVAVFNTLGAWKAGTLDKKPVDSSRLWSFTITNGKITTE